ncbi:hypothetical protein L596_000204 [Steinernema carpocapsae]|uniref:Uncharacterized protein n=1 Tax=Steinernema carpocapsae TaxID=34508 RepID=A0A4U8UHD9_STECR|nr:hypothetical protein L596_000204 [Steinernema carpocapsae]
MSKEFSFGFLGYLFNRFQLIFFYRHSFLMNHLRAFLWLCHLSLPRELSLAFFRLHLELPDSHSICWDLRRGALTIHRFWTNHHPPRNILS